MRRFRAQIPITIAIALLTMVFLFPLIPGCQGIGGEELTLYGSEPATLDPALCSDATSASYIVEIFSGLVTLNGDLEVVPDIAQSWEVSPDGTTYTFHLRPGVRFHDGKEVVASDFKYSLERAASPETSSPVAEAYLGDILGVKERLRGEAEEISGVRVIDDETLQITIDAPKAYFLSKLTHPVAFVVDGENVASGQDWTKNPNGTGPFKLREWRQAQRIVLERNEHFHNGVARVGRVTFLLVGNPMMMYEEGEIDITPVWAANIDRVLDPTNPLSQELVIVPQLSTFYVGFNTTMPPFDDVKVRQAFCRAVDKDKIIEILEKNAVSPAAGILPPGMPGYDEGLEGLSYDVEEAQRLIAASSYREGLPPIVFSVVGEGGMVSPVDVAIAWMWQQNLGVEAEIEGVEWETYLDELRGQGFQVFETGWLADYPDPENFLDILFHSQSVENSTSYSNHEVDGLLEAARVESDFDARMEIYRQVEQTIVDDAPCLPLWFERDYLLVKPYVKGYSPAPMIIPHLKDIWVEK